MDQLESTTTPELQEQEQEQQQLAPDLYQMEGAGERMADWLRATLPDLIKTLTGKASDPRASMLAQFAPSLLAKASFTDAQAVGILQTMDQLVRQGYRDVLNVEFVDE